MNRSEEAARPNDAQTERTPPLQRPGRKNRAHQAPTPEPAEREREAGSSEDEVDEASMESFPASDPPGFNGGAAGS